MAKVDTDYSGRPLRRFTKEEIAAADTSGLPQYDLVAVLDDGREAAQIDGVLYPLDAKGVPDFQNPINES